MTSPCDQRNKHHPSTAILFFKAIVRKTLKVGKLKIPNNFTLKYGGGLSNPVFLKLPDATKWEVYWTKKDDEIWFQKGWKEFARYYSLDHGHLVLFQYEESSHFDVHIFDMSAVEIDYTTFHVTHDQKMSEDSVEILGEHSPCKKTRLKSTLSSPQPRKKMKTCRIREVERSSNPQNLHQHVQTKGKQSEGTNFEMPMITTFMQEVNEGVGGGIFSTECSKVEQLTSNKTTVASITATTFRSKNPFFILVMKPSHVDGYSLTIPLEFAEKYLKKTKGVVLLQALDERTWSVVYKFPKITAGWNKFASENNLNVGNVCIFELTKKGSLSFKVFIFQLAEEPSCPLSHGRNASQTPPLLISSCLGITRSLKEAKNFTSENPIFIVDIRLRHLANARLGPNVPCLFVGKYFGNMKRTLIIQFGKRLWPVNFLYYGNRDSGKLSCGWSLFAEESKLRDGDVCIFELINRENAVLGVHVFRGRS